MGPKGFSLTYSISHSYPPPKNNILNWFYLIVNVFRISVCPKEHPWPYAEGDMCCNKEVKYDANSCAGGDDIKCSSQTIHAHQVIILRFLCLRLSRVFSSVSGTPNYIVKPKPGFYTFIFTLKNVAGDIDKNCFFFENYLR